MAKKKETKTTKAKQAGAAKPVRGSGRVKERAAAAEGAKAGAPEGTASATPLRERVRDPRLPSPGTVIEKRDRKGAVRCTCRVEDGGIRYEGKLYKSLSSAAMAAAKDLDLGGKGGMHLTQVRCRARRLGNQSSAAAGRGWLLARALRRPSTGFLRPSVPCKSSGSVRDPLLESSA